MPQSESEIRSSGTVWTAGESTVVWGQDVERGDFLKVPRALIRLGQYSHKMGKEIQPRHVLLLLDLASRRFRDQPLEVEWVHLASDFGVPRVDTVRHWAYELRELKLIKLKGKYRGNFQGGKRMRGVIIDISPFVTLISEAYKARQIQKSEREARMLEEAKKGD